MRRRNGIRLRTRQWASFLAGVGLLLASVPALADEWANTGLSFKKIKSQWDEATCHRDVDSFLGCLLPSANR